MSLDDVVAVMAEKYPDIGRSAILGTTKGLYIAIPGRPLLVERKKVKDCSTMDELRAYINTCKTV